MPGPAPEPRHTPEPTAPAANERTPNPAEERTPNPVGELDESPDRAQNQNPNRASNQDDRAPKQNPVWDPNQYLRHAGHRSRPFHDLLARVPPLPVPQGAAPRIADLGCGPGNMTAVLARRWPTARVTGLDNSAEMLDRARRYHAGATEGGGTVDFVLADAARWTPDPAEPYDLLFSNATLQWVPEHVERFADWLTGIRPGGTFAFQVPGNHDAPSHALMRQLATSLRWSSKLAGKLRLDKPVLEPAEYLDRLAALGCRTDAWETTYLHQLDGDDPVLDWVMGTGLRPLLTALADDPEACDAFLAEYRALLREAYPRRSYGTVLPFRRVFVVAWKPL
ncbi:trans-aconitate 2-methyltransferase [Streptomyces sp. NA04227]|uniref:trans-aconitate 2-methyltransferase n=1 Tax=Streptomyces sp. NA04227 TaxID=2742136 RepID=UPI00158FCBA8|nr:trans-aconitate 2-methyltransferase [Streptomyces sp. NA04227]QKW07058.1 trans-aconitate 2-methyltransferase [Streptomyces sp. NA04227]